MKFNNDEWQQEFDALVLSCYGDNRDGRITHQNALIVFMAGLDDATQAQRPWVDVVEDQARREGLMEILKARDSALKGRYVYIDKVSGKRHRRDNVVGTSVPDAETGVEKFTQMELIDLTEIQLRKKIDEAASNVRENRANIAIARKCLEVIAETGAATAREGLHGQSLEEYLAATGA